MYYYPFNFFFSKFSEMYSYSFFILIPIIVFFANLQVNASDDVQYSNCSQLFNCVNISYPFWGQGRASYCGHPGFEFKCKDNSSVEIDIESQSFRVLDINKENQTHLLLIAPIISPGDDCSRHKYKTVSLPPNNLFKYGLNNQFITLYYHCPSIPELSSNRLSCSSETEDHDNYFWVDSPNVSGCEVNVTIPVLQSNVGSLSPSTLEQVLGGGFNVIYESNVSFCNDCERSEGRCGPMCFFCRDGPSCHPSFQPRINKPKKVAIGVGAGLGGAVLVAFVIFIIYRHKKSTFKKSSGLISRDLSFDESLKPDPEMGSTYFQTPIFTYKELDEATNHFDTNKELGDGGFGTVYHGKLRDGRVVAVKRLFEHNYKRVEQFMNEIVILSQVRHRNLVSLYGCTNRHSRELLLVYEYVPNGTVADHLHGDHAKKGLLTWPIRMSIAIESADALAYLHASDIIHRDVKTNNILLDDGFHVKVADFGLSRLFPTDVTHVSTAPQGTPGYVDPEYYQCYQLNDKSDVYSFGVVLIELISSKQAVDIGRHRLEINLASMAIKKIHDRAIHELVDPTLGFESDYSVKNMITLVAELAFRCLQQEKEMRPSMVEVLETLRGIENEEYRKSDDLDIRADARLLKNSRPLSPDSVTDLWGSKATTPNTSA